MGEEGMQQLYREMKKSKTKSICKMDLRVNRLADEKKNTQDEGSGFSLLTSRLARRLGDEGVRWVGAWLTCKYAGNLVHLNLAVNSIHADGARVLADALADSSVRHLNLRMNKLGDDGAAHMAALLRRNSRLRGRIIK